MGSSKKFLILYFFFYSQDQQARTVSSFLRSLICQLLTTCGKSVFDRILLKHEFRDPNIAIESTSTLWSLPTHILSHTAFGVIYCVVDTVDECKDHQNAFLAKIKRVFQKAHGECQNRPLLKLLLISRPTSDISNEYRCFKSIQLQTKDNDLRLFVEDQVASLPKGFNLPMREEASKKLLEGAKQTFLWVSIVEGELKKLHFPSISTIKHTFTNFPKELDELYRKIVDEFLRQPGDIRVEMLIWIVYAQWPLNLEELQVAQATKTGSKSARNTEQHMIELSEETIVNYLGIILKIVHGKIHLINQSKDFLIEGKRLDMYNMTHCNSKPSDIHLARVCMTYLNFTDFADVYKRGTRAHSYNLRFTPWEVSSDYPLFNYVSSNWYKHIKKWRRRS